MKVPETLVRQVTECRVKEVVVHVTDRRMLAAHHSVVAFERGLCVEQLGRAYVAHVRTRN